MDFAAVAAALIEMGLTSRGGFHPTPADGVPALPGGIPTATLILAGNVGPAMWRIFSEQRRAEDEPHSLDHWTRRVLEPLAETLGGHALFPFGGPPHEPFQRWAQRAESVHPSPIGPLIHARYGLWHAYRDALAFPGHIELPAIEQGPRADSTYFGSYPAAAK